jgi:outer membrane protein assembly factor BamB
VSVGGLRTDWPEAGPKQVWEAALGSGSSSLVVDDMAAYTLYRDGNDEVIVALHANTGGKLWEYRYPAPIPEGYPPPEQLGPKSTPIIGAVRLYTLGSLGHVNCLNKTTGQLLWSYDAVKEFKLTPPKTGYASSPILHMDRVLFALSSEGGKRPGGLLCFHQRTDKGFLWNYHELEPIAAAPVIVPIHGKAELLVSTPNKLMAMDPLNATIRWDLDWPAAGTPVWNKSREVLIVPAAAEPGSNVLKKDGPAELKRLWSGSGPLWKRAIAVGNVVVGCSGGSPAKICAKGLFTGEQLWCDETFSEPQLLFTGNSLIILDEQGTLAVASIETDRLSIQSKTKLEHTGPWAAPAFDHRRLFLRDNKRVVVLEMN